MSTFPSAYEVQAIHSRMFIETIKSSLLSEKASANIPFPYWMTPETRTEISKMLEELGYVVNVLGGEAERKISVRLPPS